MLALLYFTVATPPSPPHSCGCLGKNAEYISCLGCAVLSLVGNTEVTFFNLYCMTKLHWEILTDHHFCIELA